MTFNRHTFARRVFLVAGIYGLITLLPQYFLEDWINQNFPPAITHPEQFYGFTGIALVWQVAFLLIASDVVRYRPLMLVAVLEKLAFAVPVIVLFLGGRVDAQVLGAGGVDLFIGVLFGASWWLTREKTAAAQPADA